MKKVFLIAITLLMVVLPIFAGDTLIRWDWVLSDSDIQYYRYQLDGTDPENWTVVDGTVSYYETDALDPYVDHTLYLQGSYDGTYWSETASAVATALAPEEVATPVVESAEIEAVTTEPAATEPEPEAEVAPVEPAVEPVAVVEPVAPVEETPVEKNNDFAFSLLFKGGFISDSTVKPFNFAFDPQLTAGLGLDFANIVKLGNNSGLGFRVDVDGVLVPVDGYFGNIFKGKYVLYKGSYEGYKLDTTAYLTFTSRNKVVAFNLGLGGGASLGYKQGNHENQSGQVTLFNRDLQVGAYGALNTGVRFYLGSVFSVGLEGSARMMIPNWEDVRYSTDLVLGFTF